MVSIASKTFLKWQILVFVRNENLRQTSTQNFMRQSRLPGSEHFLEIENNNQQEKFQIIFAHLINIFQTRKWVSWRWTRGWTRTTRSPAPAPASARWAHTASTPRIQTRTGGDKNIFTHVINKKYLKGKKIFEVKKYLMCWVVIHIHQLAAILMQNCRSQSHTYCSTAHMLQCCSPDICRVVRDHNLQSHISILLSKCSVNYLCKMWQRTYFCFYCSFLHR